MVHGNRCDGTPLTEEALRLALRDIRDATEDNRHTDAVRTICADVLAQRELTDVLDGIAANHARDKCLSEEDKALRREVRKMAFTLVLACFGDDVHDRIGRAM